MPDSLEAMFTDSEASGNPDADAFRIDKLINALDDVLNSASFYAKSNVTRRNLRGILRANSFQKFLYERYGFRIQVLDALIEEKATRVLSVDGKGRKEIIDIVSKGTMKIEARTTSEDIANRLFGGPR